MSNIKSLWQLFTNSVSKHGNRPLFHTNQSKTLKYNDVYQTSLKFKTFLQKSNVKAGDNVVVIGKNSPNWVALLYATNSIGAVLVPTFDEQQDHIKSHILNQTKPKIIFNSTTSSMKKLLKDDLSCTTLEYDYENLIFDKELNTVNNDSDLNINDIAVILYTSGTSGLPKGVPLTNLNIISNIESIKKMSNSSSNDIVTEKDKFVSFLPWNHCYGLNCELNYLVSTGASLYRNNDLTKLRKDLVTYNPTILCAVPRLFQLINKKISWIDNCPKFMKNSIASIVKSKLFGKNIRYCTVGGSAISQELLDFYNSIGLDIHQGYGTTECSPMISLNSSVYYKKGSVGKILDCNQVIIDPVEDFCANDTLNHKINKVGEILVKGSNVMSNYYGYSNMESFKMVGDNKWYRTGDIGYVDDNYLFINGRIKEQYKLSNGKFVNPIDIETTLLKIPEIHQIVVFGKDQDYNSAIIVTNSSEEIIRKKINEISNELKKYEIPKTLILTKDQFTTENGLLTQKKSQKRDVIIKQYVNKII